MRNKIRFYLKILVVLIIFLTICAYGLYEASGLLGGPKINIEYPKNGLTVRNKLITVSGTATNISFISINGRPIYINGAGRFTEQIILSNGYNSLYVEARDRIGKEKKEIIDIMLEENPASSTEDGLAEI